MNGYDLFQLKLGLDRNVKALIVEDADDTRKIVVAMLKNLGYDDLVGAENGQEALQVLQVAKVDLLLTNWNMPVMDGLQLVKQVRCMPQYADLPVLLFTSKASKQDVVTALKAGVDGYLAKPFTPSQLREQLEGILNK